MSAEIIKEFKKKLLETKLASLMALNDDFSCKETLRKDIEKLIEDLLDKCNELEDKR